MSSNRGNSNYSKPLLSKIKKRKAITTAEDVILRAKIENSDNSINQSQMASGVHFKVTLMSTQKLYSFLKENGYVFDILKANWVIND